MVLVWHVISQDDVIKGLYDFMRQRPSWRHHPAKFSAHKQNPECEHFLLYLQSIEFIHFLL